MKYDRTSRYKDDYSALSDEDKRKARSLYGDFKKFIETGDLVLRKRFDIHTLHTPGKTTVWAAHLEGDFVFTYNFIDGPGEQTLIFRRIGRHGIYDCP
jgi:mRNA-degrading endonuclease YafQ of YafQ-DinJ toxin-antitoxin module